MLCRSYYTRMAGLRGFLLQVRVSSAVENSKLKLTLEGRLAEGLYSCRLAFGINNPPAVNHVYIIIGNCRNICLIYIRYGGCSVICCIRVVIVAAGVFMSYVVKQHMVRYPCCAGSANLHRKWYPWIVLALS